MQGHFKTGFYTGPGLWPEPPFSARVPKIVSHPEAGFEAKRTFATKKPAFAGEKPGDSPLF
jgi:hypothetical protein